MPESRTKLLRMLAEIDQQIREAESLATDESLDADERGYAEAQLSFQRRALKRVEEMLNNPNEGK
jgi:hypothetical protein